MKYTKKTRYMFYGNYTCQAQLHNDQVINGTAVSSNQTCKYVF